VHQRNIPKKFQKAKNERRKKLIVTTVTQTENKA